MHHHAVSRRRLCVAALVVAGWAASLGAVVPAGWSPKPGEFIWMPGIAPAGPLVIVVSLPLQQLHVYRNGVHIGASTISSGKPGHETPTGAFTILQKHAEHYSNLYDDAPMPWMQRLTWSGVALHAGRLPGRPASHGCIRLPDAFAKTLFSATRTGDLVLVTDRREVPTVATAPDVVAGLGGRVGEHARGDVWRPDLAPAGPLSIVISTSDQQMVVTRNGRRIGRTRLRVERGLQVGTQAYVLLDGRVDRPDPVLPGRRARRWMAIDLGSPAGAGERLREALSTGRITIPEDAARRLDDLVDAGTTVVITDEPLGDAPRLQGIDLESAIGEGAPQ